MSDMRHKLDALRDRLGKLDETLVELLDARAKLAKEAAALRQESTAGRIFVKPSEALLGQSPGNMPDADLRRIIADIQAACSAIESPERIVFSGPPGGTAHAAARRRFSPTTAVAATESAALALEEVARKRADTAIVPLESSNDGPVQGTVLALSQTDLKISEILEQSTELHAFRASRAELPPIRKVFATATDHHLCTRYVAALVAEGAVITHTASSIEACQTAAADESAVALAPDPFGIDAGLTVVHPSVSDVTGGRTRFALISARPHPRTGKDSTAIVFTVRDTPGALLDVLKQFAERDLNLTNIYSRPITGGAWAYLFFVEISGHFTDRAVVTACEDVRKLTTMFKIVGAYPAA